MEASPRSPAQPALVLGLTFLCIGLTFALPHQLVGLPDIRAFSKYLSLEVANVYACVAWAGWAHFLYAFRGQGGALARIKDDFRAGRLVAYIAVLAVTIALLVGLRSVAGITLFGAIVWAYFIDHFLKAERAFENPKHLSEHFVARWLSSYQPILTFGWLSIVLLDVWKINSYPWSIWIVSAILSLIVLGFGGYRNLVAGDVRGPLLSLFFVAEALVWGTFSRYGGPIFLTGVYVFHIAAGSYFHYFGSYFVAHARTAGKDKLVNLFAVVAVNVAVGILGYLVVQTQWLSWLKPILSIEWFTLWVAVHLVASDAFPFIKKLNPQQSTKTA